MPSRTTTESAASFATSSAARAGVVAPASSSSATAATGTRPRASVGWLQARRRTPLVTGGVRTSAETTDGCMTLMGPVRRSRRSGARSVVRAAGAWSVAQGRGVDSGGRLTACAVSSAGRHPARRTAVGARAAGPHIGAKNRSAGCPAGDIGGPGLGILARSARGDVRPSGRTAGQSGRPTRELPFRRARRRPDAAAVRF